MKTTTRAGLALILAATAMPVLAVDEMRPYVTGGYTNIFQDDSRLSDNGQGFFLGAGKALSQHWGFEYGVFHDQFDKATPAGNTWRDFGAKIDGMFFYSRDRHFSPYVGVGVGGMRTQLVTGGAGTSTDPFADFGVGFFKYFDIGSGDFGLHADVRYRWLNIGGDLPGVGSKNEPVARIGLVMALGAKPEVAAVGDADGDGVADNADLCPNTPKGAKVDAKGCPVDSDGDGVFDDKDLCPDTPKGAKVDEHGCTVTVGGVERRFDDVHFAFDHYDLDATAKTSLDSTASVINGLAEQNPKVRVKVDGHTDWIGTDGYNMGLGERRANAVKQYLMRKGVAGDRIDTTSYGESKPVATNKTAEGRALNRRTEVRTTADE